MSDVHSDLLAESIVDAIRELATSGKSPEDLTIDPKAHPLLEAICAAHRHGGTAGARKALSALACDNPALWSMLAADGGAKGADSVESARLHKSYGIELRSSIPEEVQNLLPEPVGCVTRLVGQSQRWDVFLAAALPVLSACTPNVEILHGGNLYETHLYVAIVAPPAAGKGAIRYARRLGSEVDGRLRRESVAARERWEEASREYEESRRLKEPAEHPGDRPPGQSLFIPANASARPFFDALAARSGRACIFETEIDTLTNATSQEWGRYDDALRKAYHHEPISYLRSESEFHLERPCLAVVLSGTESQFLELIPSADNGLFSRFGLFYFAEELRWISQRPSGGEPELNEAVQSLARLLDRIHLTLAARSQPVQVTFGDSQWDRLEHCFAARLTALGDDGLSHMAAIPKRGAIAAARIAATLAIINGQQDGLNLGSCQILKASDVDIEASVMVADVFVDHAVRFGFKLPSARAGAGKRRGLIIDRFYASLPDQFQTGEAVEIAAALKIKERTAKQYLAVLRDDGQLERERHGCYRKARTAHSARFALPAQQDMQ